MFLSSTGRRGRRLRGLGTVATQVGNSLVYSSNPVAVSNLRRAIPVVLGVRSNMGPIQAPWRGSPPRYGGWTAGDSPYGSTPQNPTGVSLATAQALLQSNPSLLTSAQWQQLQQAGLVANTVPYSSASQVPSTSSAIDPATGVPYATELATAQAGTAAAAPTTGTDIGTMLGTTYAGLPLYLWLLIGGGGAYFMSQKRGR